MAKDKFGKGKPLSFEEGVQRRAAAKKAKSKVLAPGRMRLKRPDKITPEEEKQARVVRDLSIILDEVVNTGVGWTHFLIMLSQIAEHHPVLAAEMRDALAGKI
jgi:hypothetical protein